MKYRTLVADPPWPYPDRDRFPGVATGGHISHGVRTPRGAVVRKSLPYPSMTVRDLCNLPVRGLAERDARLFLWATSSFLPVAFEVLTAWGFSYRQTLVWDKRPNINPLGGSVAPNAAEFLLVGVCGSPELIARWPASVISARKARTTHSVKPEVFIDMVETVSPPPYVELFSRRHRMGWDVHGFESANTAQWPEAVNG
jgi:N6-adenosine-specific RNA methylase IME4